MKLAATRCCHLFLNSSFWNLEFILFYVPEDRNKSYYLNPFKTLLFYLNIYINEYYIAYDIYYLCVNVLTASLILFSPWYFNFSFRMFTIQLSFIIGITYRMIVSSLCFCVVFLFHLYCN